MRLSMVRWLATAAISGGTVAGISLLMSYGEDQLDQRIAVESSPAGTPVAAEFESEAAEAAAAMLARSDSHIEDDSAQPIRQMVQVERGDTLGDVLARANVARAEAQEAITALKDVFNPRDLKAGQQITLTFERPADRLGTGAFNGVVLQPEADRLVAARRDGENGFEASQVKQVVTRQLARYRGTIKSSLFESASAIGMPGPVLVDMIAAFSYDVDFQRDIQAGDTFEVAFERYTDKKGNVVRDGAILFANMTLSGNALTIYRFTDAAGESDYYTPKGESVRKALLRTPVDAAKLTSGFGMRSHPILGYTRMHRGVDFGVSPGTPVMAAGAGTVEEAGQKGAYGNYLRLRHNGEYSTAYAHLSRFAAGIRHGAHVKQGQVIAYSGATGLSSGPHLHYETIVNGIQVNPLSVKVASGNRLSGKDLDRFQTGIHETERLVADLPSSTKVAANLAAVKPRKAD